MDLVAAGSAARSKAIEDETRVDSLIQHLQGLSDSFLSEKQALQNFAHDTMSSLPEMFQGITEQTQRELSLTFDQVS